MTTRMFWATMLATTCLWPVAALSDGPLPTDPNAISGDITISTPSATQLMLTQAGAYGIVDWGSFSIARGFGVRFENGTGATLNRVTGTELSSIMGQLDATGSVYLVNQKGIVFGETGVVNTGGTFVASTLDIDNADFLDGGDATFRGTSNGYVINLGSVSSLGGDVAILGRNVVNEGSLSAPNGTVGLAAGREILMRDASVADGLFSVRIGGDDTSVTDSGAISAAAAELRANGGNVYALAGNTGGTIASTGVARVNGRVFLTAGATGAVTVDKPVKATAAGGAGGTITVDGGQVDVAGVLDASGTTGGDVRITSDIATVFSGRVLAFGDGTAGSGGFAEVSGRHLSFGGTVETRGGTVLIDPENIEITNSEAALLSGATLLTPGSIETLLLTQNVIVQTSSAGSEAGTIVVSDAIDWSTASSLTFLAHGDIWFNASVQNSSVRGGDLNIVTGWDGSTSTTAFDAAPFLAADLGTQTLFGSGNGVGYTLSGSDFDSTGLMFIRQATVGQTTSVGSRAGATRYFGGTVFVGMGSGGFSQLGYGVQTGGDGAAITGDILVRSTGLMWLTGASFSGSAAQIGHGGMYFLDTATPTSDMSGTIQIEALSSIALDGGTGSNSYAMIGHGSLDSGSGLQAQGARSGNIVITTRSDMSIEPGAEGASSAGWIGHSTASGAISAADLTVTATSYDLDRTTFVGSGGISVLDVAMLAENTQGGTVTFVATDDAAGAELSLFGTTANTDCECSSIDTAGNLIIQAAGDVSLASDFAFSNTGGGNVVLAAGRNFRNASGADAFGTMKGFWHIFSTRPDSNVGDIGTFTNIAVYTDATFDTTDPLSLPRGNPASVNALVYSKVPTVTVGDVTITYGDTLVLPGAEVTVDGTPVDPLAWGFTIDSTLLDESLVTYSTTGNVNAGTYAEVLGFEWSPLASISGNYDFIFFDNGTLQVDQAVLTGSIIGEPVKVYDATTDATLSGDDFLLTGFVEGESATVIQTAGTYATANASSEISVTASLTADDVMGDSSTDLANYILPATVAGTGAITPATLTAALVGSLTKAYDGDSLASLSPENFLLSGFFGTDGAEVTLTTGFYRGSDADPAVFVDVELIATDFDASGTTLLSNYFLPDSAFGLGSITPATLTASIIGTPTKVYDGTAAASLSAANFLLDGFVAGEGATVNQTSGTYASADASATNLVTATLSAGNFDATGTTQLSNYTLPTIVTGNGVISQGLLVAGIVIGTPTKVYDGNSTAMLTAANFLLSGFVEGEGATVTETLGSYADANASGSNLVTVVLEAGDFVATGSTTLANYVLPTTVAGNGAITQATLNGSVIGTPTKVYDGNDVATLTAGNFLLGGFVAGEGATVAATAGTYSSANASGTNEVTVTLVADDFNATGGTLLANYILPTIATGNGAITQATLVGSIIGTPTKVYDGTIAARLTAANFQLDGFVAGQGATIAQTAATYASANALATNAVTVTLAAGDFNPTSGTVLSNYVLPATLTGNGAITQAALTGAIIGTPTKTYDGTTLATLSLANFALGGFIDGEGATVTKTTGTYASADASLTNLVTVSLAVGDFSATGGTLLANYALPDLVTGNGAITQAALTGAIIGTPTKVYDATTSANLTATNFLLSGFVAGQGATVSQTFGTYASADASETNVVTAALAAGDFSATAGTSLANYLLPTAVSGNGAITQAILTGTIIGSPAKVYDGTTFATLTAANYLLSGFVAGEEASIIQTVGTYASANASGTNAVTAALAAGDFSATGATRLGNYVLPTTVSGNGVITQATLTGAVVGTPTKAYDGTTTATLSAANFLLSGFVAGEGASVIETAGNYASANAATVNPVTVTLDASDFAALDGTLLDNYSLPTTVSGNGAIDRAVLSVAIIGAPTKPFDGSGAAILTPANFSLIGFVAGQGATVTQTQGTYATPTTGSANTITANLTEGDFVATDGTLLANYILPTTASGTGLVDIAPPSQPAIPATRGLETFASTPLGQPAGPATGIEVINAETTQRILDEIRAGSTFCKALIRQEFVIDCLSDRLQSVADGLSAVGEYSEVRAVLEEAAQQLHALALANASAELAQQVVRAGGRRSSRPLTAVSSDALGAANAQASAIIETAQLVLLRSSSGSAQRSVAFTQVAQVVNSTKVLLRSS